MCNWFNKNSPIIIKISDVVLSVHVRIRQILNFTARVENSIWLICCMVESNLSFLVGICSLCEESCRSLLPAFVLLVSSRLASSIPCGLTPLLVSVHSSRSPTPVCNSAFARYGSCPPPLIARSAPIMYQAIADHLSRVLISRLWPTGIPTTFVPCPPEQFNFEVSFRVRV